ncbi:3-deoxy-manno-octulosonate cytidylyltransferase [Salicola sp. Rm-C-2C1-2]|uniref:3-deoxy-manno-octulosonate cytidylyltransferase n=1 Tax=Salicola sp. Rm-C-2C1-2 TaxID=3141321 RepID=UPI0032E4FAB2
MAFTVVIPARYASSRLPGKPLADIGGRPMIQHVWDRAAESGAGRVIIATDSEYIADAVHGFGGQAVMTRDDHPSGTDRLEEVASSLALDDEAIVVNVQGDEPLLPAALIDQVAGLLEGAPDAAIATLCEPITNPDELFNPNAVKVVMDNAGRALYFSRAPIPWDRATFETGSGPEWVPDTAGWYRHIGLYAYRVSLLHQFVGWQPTPLERAESLEQLRALWHGARIQVGIAEQTPPAGVDTEADLERVRVRLAGQSPQQE